MNRILQHSFDPLANRNADEPPLCDVQQLDQVLPNKLLTKRKSSYIRKVAIT